MSGLRTSFSSWGLSHNVRFFVDTVDGGSLAQPSIPGRQEVQ